VGGEVRIDAQPPDAMWCGTPTLSKVSVTAEGATDAEAGERAENRSSDEPGLGGAPD
jgi:hypothetical protein